MRKPRQKIALRDLEAQVARLRRSNQKLKTALETDELTGLYNSRSLKSRLDATLKRRLENGQEPALLFLDVDRFKSVNELHGHRAAGHLLCQVGEVIRQFVREGDVAFRYGGDEFVILVSGGHAGANGAGERIRRHIESHRFEVNGLKGPSAVRLTVSVGVCVMRLGDTAAEILDQADRAMFEAKRVSRNKVVCSAD